MSTSKHRPNGPVKGTCVPAGPPIITSVLATIDAGFPVFACAAREKRPVWSGGCHSATKDFSRIKHHWRRNPRDNYGIPTGADSGLFVLDIDGPAGRSSLAALKRVHGPLPATVIVLTGNGCHHYFRHPGQPVGNSAGRLGTGIDIRGDGGYVIGVGSVHETGHVYRYAADHDPANMEIAEAPAWLIELVTKPNNKDTMSTSVPLTDVQRERAGRYAKTALEREDRRLASAPNHRRNDTLNCCAFSLGQLVGARVLDEGEVVARLRFTASRIGLEPNEIENTIASGLEAGKSQPRDLAAVLNGKMAVSAALANPKVDQITVDLAKLGCTDTDNGIRLASRCGHQLAYCPQLGWLVWDGQRWRVDGAKQRILLAQEVAKRIADEAPLQATEEARTQRTRFGSMSLSKGGIERMLDMGSPMMVVNAAQLDADPWLLNVENGTIDLRTGRLDPHDSRDMLTMLAPVKFDRRAETPMFRAFMKRALDADLELYRFLQRAFGYSLTGLTTEQVLFYARGRQKNGKSTLINLFRELLGDYGIHTPTETLLAKQYDNAIPNDLARLDGIRMVTAIEATAGKQLDEGRVKAMTGGDPITARFLRHEFFQFVPQFKLWFVANDDPRVRSTDDALWRRIRVIPFEVVIPEDERDPDLPSKLKAELPGILAWAVRGCLEWQRIGLSPPQRVTEATGAYRQRADHVKRFISECIIHEEGTEISASALRRTYEDWCSKAHEYPLSVADLKQRLIDLDLTPKRHNTGRVWVNVGIRRR